MPVTMAAVERSSTSSKAPHHRSSWSSKCPIKVQASRPLGRKLVGFTLPKGGPLPEECCLVIRDGTIVGRVTSAARSGAAGATIGLAYVHPDDSEAGKSFTIKLEDGNTVTATVATLPFYDPANARQEL